MVRMFILLVAWLTLSLSALASVNINTAAEAELETLPGIGPSKAAAIVAYRTDHGPFQAIDDLDNVPGIGPATLSNVRPMVILDPSGSSTGATHTAADAPASASPPRSSASTSIVNVNNASAKQLEALPGIGPSKAAAIVSDRDENGPYTTCAELQRVSGIGPATLANISPRCAVR